MIASRRRIRLLVGALMLISACAPTAQGPYRDQAVPMGATSRFDANSFSGDWRVVARFGASPPATLSVRETADGGVLRLDGETLGQIAGAYRAGVSGELTPVGSDREALVVMWVDEDFETAAIGTASGSFGALLDRDGVVPEDRAAAARRVFEFYGWDVSALEGAGS
jgi:apolipoprotein D and lipocalin family protein